MAPEVTIERPLPSSLEAERGILGAILLDNQSLNPALEILRTEDFFSDHHRRIFDGMVQLFEAGKAIDLLTLTDELRRKGELESAGGTAYLASLVDGVPRISNVPHYARIVKEKSLMRHLVHTAHSIEQRALEAELGADEMLDTAESEIFRLAEDRIRQGFVSVKELVQTSYARIDKLMSEGRAVTGLATGYHALDEMTSGLQASDLIILAARPSMGKTALALNIAENVATAEGRVALFSLEMSKEALLMRLLSSHARVDSHKFRTGHLNIEDREKMSHSLNELARSTVWIDDSSSSTVVEMGAKARRLKSDKGLDLVIVDYLQLMTARGRFGNRNEEVSSISRGLKAMAKELAVPVLVLSQLTRAPERDERRPHLADLRESGAIEQDADIVVFINRPGFYKPDAPDEERNRAEIIIAKQRNGPTGVLKFVFLHTYTRFEQASNSTMDDDE
ncbi:MAG TPA: replicative DNA helicase [Candidatus Acidoferrales bacterium]|nr:replicative DNA helicase [Candidatus Acidoferrales bacterium]